MEIPNILDTKVEDWQNNVINKNDTVSIYRIKDKDTGKYCWEKLTEFSIKDCFLFLGVVITIDKTEFVKPLLEVIKPFSESSEFAVCIKEVSDNRDDFYLNYFKVN